jgi:hypothetical protein
MKKLSSMGMYLAALVLFAVVAYLVYGQEEKIEEWVATYNGPGNSTDMATAMAVDLQGNIYVTGGSWGGLETQNDFATIKYDKYGNVVWVARYDGPGESYDWPRAIVVDFQGNVYVIGDSHEFGTDYDYTTVKHDRNGNVVWVARYDGPGEARDLVLAIAVDFQGNVYVTGISDGIGTYPADFATVKYDRSGNEVWVARYNGPGNHIDRATAIATDKAGNVYVTGYSRGIGTYGDYATIKYDKDGNEVWVARYDGPGESRDDVSAIAIDIAGNVYVTGESYEIGTDHDYTTVKYDKDGNEVWVAEYDGPAGNPSDLANAIAVDFQGNVYVTGQSRGIGTSFDYATVKYDKDGNEVWVGRYNGPGGNPSDVATAIAVDLQGNIYVTGNSGYIVAPVSYNDFATVKYDKDGNEVWVGRYNGPANSEDRTAAIAIDKAGNIYVTGFTWQIGTYRDYVTIKYSR